MRLDGTQKSAIALLLCLLLYSLFFEPFNVQVTDDRLDFFEGEGEQVKAVLISDTQGAYYDEAYFGKVIDLINKEEPDIVLIAGDVVDGEPEGYGRIGRLADIRSAHGVYAVLGNHDYRDWDCGNPENYGYADSVAGKLGSLGITVLRNENTVLDIRGRRFAIAGVDDLWACRSDLGKGLRGLEPAIPRIILTHESAAVSDEPLPGRNLILSGHTHCGQVDVPPITDFIVSSLGFGKTKRGWARLSGDDTLYVTCGITPGGIRLFAPPEITVITLA